MTWEGYVLLGLLASLLLGSPRIAARIFERRLELAGMGLPESTSDEEMQRHLSLLMGSMGYRVERATPAEPEFDLLLVDGLGHRRGLVTRHFRRPVTMQLVEEAARAAKRLGMTAPVVVSVRGFTLPGRSAARRTGVITWELTDLIMAIERIKAKAALLQESPGRDREPEGLADDAERVRAQPAAEGASSGRAFMMQLPTSSTLFKSKSHRRQARMRKGETWNSSDTPNCPRCSRPMVVRSGSDGPYWGCSSFPRCLGSRPR